MSESWTVEPGFEPERYELHEEPAYQFELDRRDFLKSLGGGILVLCLVDASSAQQPGAQPRGGAGRRRGGGGVRMRPRKSVHGCTLARMAGSRFTRAKRRWGRTSARP